MAEKIFGEEFKELNGFIFVKFVNNGKNALL